MLKRRIDPTLIGLFIILLIAVGLVSTFLVASSIVSQDDARIYPTTATPTPYPFYSPYYPPPVPTSPAAVLGPVLDPRPPAVSRTKDGITIIVQPRYADLHRVVLTYTISGPTQSYPYLVGLDPNQGNWPRLTSEDGTDLPSNSRNIYETPYSDWIFLPSGEPTPNEGILSFDTSVLPNLPTTLALHLAMPIIVNNAPYIQVSPIPTVAPGVRATNTPTSPNPPGPPPNSSLTFDFDLSTQVDNLCRQVQPALSVEKSGIKMTLDSVSVTASEARANLTFSGTFNGMQVNNSTTVSLGSNWNASGTMDTGPGTAQLTLWDNCAFSNCSPFTGFHYRAESLLDAPQAQWLLKVDNLYDDQGGASIAGPWVFKFDVPSASPCTSVPTPSGAATSTPTP